MPVERLFVRCLVTTLWATFILSGCATSREDMRAVDAAPVGDAVPSALPRSAKAEELSPGFGLGLDSGLSWGMRSFFVNQIFNFQRAERTTDYSAPADSNAITARIDTRQHAYAGCSFALRFYFYSDRLDKIGLDSVGPTLPCLDRVKRDLESRYGMGDRANGTSVTFDIGDQIHILLSDQNDVAGRKVAEQNPKCQEISVQILPGQDAPGVSGLALSGLAGVSLPASRPELGCYFYHPMLLQFSTQGTVQFEMHVLADGTVATADIVSAKAMDDRKTSSSLLGLFAQTFAWKLQFTPATRDGQPIEVIRRVDIVYTIKHPIVYPRSRAIN